MKVTERQFKVVVRCADCGTELNSTVPLSSRQVQEEWPRLAISSALVTGSCPRGCRATFSDCNINTNMTVVDIASGKDVDFATLKLTDGHFYSESHHDLCPCAGRADDELYESERYPTVHGTCGKFVEAYRG